MGLAAESQDAPGVTRDGGFGEYVIGKVESLVHKPNNVEWSQAAAATDAGVTSYSGVVVHGGVEKGMRVGILGLGGLGLTGARIAVIQGAEVIGIEPREEVWQSAKFDFESFDFIARAITLQGSTPVGNPKHLKAVLEIIDSGGGDRVFERWLRRHS